MEKGVSYWSQLVSSGQVDLHMLATVCRSYSTVQHIRQHLVGRVGFSSLGFDTPQHLSAEMHGCFNCQRCPHMDMWRAKVVVLPCGLNEVIVLLTGFLRLGHERGRRWDKASPESCRLQGPYVCRQLQVGLHEELNRLQDKLVFLTSNLPALQRRPVGSSSICRPLIHDVQGTLDYALTIAVRPNAAPNDRARPQESQTVRHTCCSQDCPEYLAPC